MSLPAAIEPISVGSLFQRIPYNLPVKKRLRTSILALSHRPRASLRQALGSAG